MRHVEYAHPCLTKSAACFCANKTKRMAEENIPGEMEITEIELDAENVARLLRDDEEKQTDTTEQDMEQSDTASVAGPRLFVGGLNSKTKEQDLRNHFDKYGTMTECSIARKKPRDVGQKIKSRGFGFVTMATMAETDAILKDTHVINDKVVSVMISKPPDAPERKLRLCITTLDIEATTEETMKVYFSQFGTLTECSIAKEQKDGKMVSRGIGFITMTTEDEVKAVLDESIDGHHTLDGKTVTVKRVVNDTQYYVKNRKLWFGGLDKEKTTESDLIEHFNTFGTVQDCTIIRNPPETEGEECKSKGYGFINMASVVETGAILKHGGTHKIHGKELVFNRAPQRPSDPDFDLYPVKQIYVSGLQDTSLNADNLKAYFNTHGNVRYVTMMREQGAAKVTLDSADDVEKIAHMRDHLIQRFWITVRKADPLAASDKSDRPGKTIKTSKAKQSGLIGINKPKRLMGMGGGSLQSKNQRNRGFMQTGSRKNQSPRQAGGFGSQGVRGYSKTFAQYYDQPRQARGGNFGGMAGGFGSQGQQFAETFYEDDPSGYGPVRGRGVSQSAPRGRVSGHGRGGGGGAGGAGGWVFVENLYGQQQEQAAYPNQRSTKGSKGKGRGSVLSTSYGDSGGLGGGYEEDWGEGTSMNRGRGWPY